MPARIIIGADLVPTKSNQELFERGDAEKLIGVELTKILKNADFTIFNLEVPLADKETPIDKWGPNLVAGAASVKGLQAVNPHFFSLANNHILDQGEQGLLSTISLLDEAGIRHAGAGRNLADASKPYIYEKTGSKIGIYCCAEHEFSIAEGDRAGVNPFDSLESLDHIACLKARNDYVIVLYHGGKEHYPYPSPYLQKVCRKIVEKGADLVVCQHSHCIGCEEKWRGGTIVYGQGNFLFDLSEEECWQTGLLIELRIDRNNAKINYLPLVKDKNTIRAAQGIERQTILDSFRKRSEEILKPDFITGRYQVLAEEMQYEYLKLLAGKTTKNVFFRVINKLSGYSFMSKYLEKKYPKRERTALQNYIECEAHRELLIEILRDGQQQRN